MLRVIVLINQKTLIDTHAVRLRPKNAKNGDMCTYEVNGDGWREGFIKQKFELGTGAAKLAIKLLKRHV